MDKTAMVSVDIRRGSDILRALESAKVKVNALLWAFLPEYEDWRLVVSSRQFDSSDQRSAYERLHDSIAPAGFVPSNTPPIMILPTNDPFIREVRRVVGKTNRVEGMRLGGQTFGDRFVEDAYVYRIA